MKVKYLFLIMIIGISIFTLGCTGTKEDNINGNTIADISYSSDIEKVEILHFHGTHQCYSCITVGDYAEETVNTYFADEVGSGKVYFAHINGDLPENEELVLRYGATGSSLWIGIYGTDGSFSAEENVNVWYKIKDKEEYMNYLKGIIEQKLAGN